MSYVDLNGVHNPATGTAAPATWGDQIRDNFEFLIDPPACSVSHSTTQTLTNNTTTSLSADTELFDNDSMHSTVTNNSRITIQTAGRYLLIITLSYANGTLGSRAAQFRVNGTTSYNGQFLATTPSPNTHTLEMNATRTLVFAAGDYVEARAYQDNGGNLSVQLLEFAATYLTR